MAKFISIDIGSKNIKIVEGSSDKKNINIIKAVSVDTPASSMSEGNIIDYENIRNVIKQTITKNGIKTKNVVFSINTTSLITRTIELPVVKSSDETIQMIRFELEQFLPVVLDEYKIVFRIIKNYVEDGVKKGSYLINAVPTKLIDDYRKLSDDLGLRLQSIDLSFNSLERVFSVGRTINDVKIEKDKAYYVLEFGHKSIIFNVISNGNNLFTRIINLGGSDIDVGIENMFEVNSENAEKIKHKFSTLDTSEIETEEEKFVNNIIETNLSSWINEIRRLIQYFNSRNKGIVIDNLFIYGGSSNIKSIDNYFSEALEIESQIIKDISGFKSGSSKLMEEFNLSEYLDAVSGLLVSKNDMNLLSDIIKMKQSRLKGVFTGSILLGAVALALILYYLNFMVEVNSLNNEIDYYDDIINNPVYQEKYQEMQAMENKINVLKEYKSALSVLNEQLSKSDTVQTDLLNFISSTVPVDISIDSLSINGENIVIQGTSILRESVAQLEKNLKDIDIIDKVFIPSIAEQEKNVSNYSFSVNCTIKDVN
ncbi:type IV pilus assembly protein PilM [Dethiosulfatibacter aminovorans DSM 17477]|uniref:Type IV pilus assembly protein PilM n=1 Tax=Dethiosulfatibacter aminovorans DSM 17477 TaxID=1121476 RepID=A0A1M6D7R2_9FIRM|nr:type IV pilus assembly protein PilM [Dethiosulfatibacter aminovorans]SHI69262.1 type IV pilus assembly protein PilM [Dethiosulfatibacter aminovorans DSM 17477]